MTSRLVAGVVLALAAVAAQAQTTAPAPATAAPPPPLQYGEPVALAKAAQIAAAAVAEARRNNWNMAIAIVDPAGRLVLFQRMDQTQAGSVDVAIGKARTSALFRVPSKAFQDRLAQGGANALFLLKLEGAVPIQGGLPLVVDGRVIGAIGVSGSTGPDDSVVAEAGVRALAGP